MPEYRSAIAKKALRELAALPIEIQDRVMKTFDKLAMNPLPAGSKKLRGALRAYRVRVGDDRVIYEIKFKSRSTKQPPAVICSPCLDWPPPASPA